MKKKIMIGLLGLLGTLAAIAASVTLAWDANDPAEQVTGYWLYEKVGTNWVKLGFTTNTTMTLDVKPGLHIYAVTATNFWGESDFSNAALTPATNRPPGGIKIRR